MVGCCEVIEYIFYVADTCISLGHLISKTTDMNAKFEPLIWLAFYVSSVSVYCIGGAFFWRVSNILAFLSIMILVIYCLGSASFADFGYTKYVDYEAHSTQNGYNRTKYRNVEMIDTTMINGSFFDGGISKFMNVIPLAGWFFVGIESLNFASNDIIEVT